MRVGIDFGTCLTSAAVLIGDTPTLVKDSRKLGYSFPSSVYIAENNETLVGHAAEYQRLKAPHRYRREFKRDLGQCDPYLLGDRSMMPEDLVAEVLRKVRTEADAMLGGQSTVTEAVIGVPAAYSGFKRGLMIQSARKAGFEAVELIEEPVAAAMHYAWVQQRGAGRVLSDGDILLVYDLGGGTFDAALLQKSGPGYSSLALPAGLEHCGGVDFDRLIFEDLRSRCSPYVRELLDSRRDLEALRTRVSLADLCREIKHQLSEAQEAETTLPVTPAETYRLTRGDLSAMVSPLIEQTFAVCRRLVQEAGVGWEGVAGVLMVGGCARVPAVHEMVARELKRPVFRVDEPELAICQGAALVGKSPAAGAGRTAAVLVVSATPGPGEFASIGKAVRGAPAGALIEVREGRYEDEVSIDKPVTLLGTGDRDATVLTGVEGPALTLWGGGIEIRNLSLRSKAPQTTDNNADSAVRIRDGAPLLEDCDIASLNGTALAVEGGETAPTVRRCVLHDALGGLVVKGGRGLLEDCCIERNRRVGAVARNGADPVLRRCVIRYTVLLAGEDFAAGFLAESQGRGTLEDCDIHGNARFGVLAREGGDPVLRRCRIHHNKPGVDSAPEFGFASLDQGLGTLEECEIFGDRIGVAVSKSAPTLRRCRIQGSKGPSVNIVEQSRGTLEDCTVAAKDETAIVIRQDSDPSIRRCAIHCSPGFPGILAIEKARGAVEDCRFEEESGWNWCVFAGSRVRGLIDAAFYEPLRTALARKDWTAADQASIALLRRASGVRTIADMDLAQRLPDEMLRSMDELWMQAGGGPVRDRSWVNSPVFEATGVAGWFSDETCLQRRLRESGVWSSVPPHMFEAVRQALAKREWGLADERSKALVLHAAGCACISSGVQANSISKETLRALSALWKEAGKPLNERYWVTDVTVGACTSAGIFSNETWLQRRLRECG